MLTVAPAQIRGLPCSGKSSEEGQMAKIRIYIPGFDIPKTEGVKYGDYMVIYDEAGNALVVDAGQRPASAVLREWIKKQRFKRIWMVGTHPHTDHIKGIIDAINDPDINVEKVWLVSYDAIRPFTKSKYKSKSWYSRVCSMYERCAKGLYDLCRSKGVAVGWLATGTHVRIGDIHCKVLWQAPNSYSYPDADQLAGTWLNNFSPLLLFDFGLFVAGDNQLEHDAARSACRPVIVASVPHHGNYVDKTAFKKLCPKAAFYNYGEARGTIGKDKGFTSWTIPVLQKMGTEIWNNFRDGEIRMMFTDDYVVICGDRNDRTATYSLGSYCSWSRSDEELAVEVMLRLHGNGDARKNALGTRYSAVQKIVGSFCTDRDLLIDAIADYILRGLAGNGDTRKVLIGDYYPEAQARVNEKLRG